MTLSEREGVDRDMRVKAKEFTRKGGGEGGNSQRKEMKRRKSLETNSTKILKNIGKT